MKSREIRILSTCIAFVVATAFLSGCGDTEKVDGEEKSTELNTENAIASGNTIIEPEPISSLEEIQTYNELDLDAEPTSMEGILSDLSDTFGDAADETQEVVTDVVDNLASVLEDSAPAVQDTAKNIGDGTAKTVDTAITAPVAEIIEDADEVVAATPDLIRRIQQALTNAGYKPGPADGISGPRTLNALKSYQQDNNLASGELTKETLRALGVNH